MPRISRQTSYPAFVALMCVALTSLSRGADSTTTANKLADHLAVVQRQIALLPKEPSFTIEVAGPFVVIGNESPAVVRAHVEKTINWATRHLKKLYFERDPAGPIDIWLFRDAASYQSGAEKLFGKPPQSQYGYFSQQHSALVMNISTGGGTLVHELVHAYIATNFPSCPTWFNEGLASLYEQPTEREGKIVGLVNWRLLALQTAIHERRVSTFEQLTSTTPAEFYAEKAVHYGMARYLCLWLQEQGKLQAFYKRFVASVHDDPTGYRTLVEVLAREDMNEFQSEWEAWVLTLKKP